MNLDVPVFIGTYTSEGAPGIYQVDLKAGKLSEPFPVATVVNPSFLARHPSRNFVYTVNESKEFNGEPGGGVSAFTVDKETGEWTLLNQQPTGSAGPCHLAVDRTGSLLVVANYSGGSVSVFPLQPDGALAPRSDFHQHIGGSGANPKRQRAPHAHGVTFSPDHQYVLVPDLGADAVVIYSVDLPKQRLLPHGRFVSNPGAGPRHVVFSPDGRQAYVVNELDNTVTTCNWDAESGSLEAVESLSTLPPDWTGESTTAEIAITASGKWVIASNRGHDSLAVFRRDLSSGRLTLMGITACRGKQPRSFSISPDDSHVVAAYQSTNALEIFALDSESGALTPLGEPVSLTKPVCVIF